MKMKLWIISIYVEEDFPYTVGVVYGQCPNGWIRHDSSCYRLRSDTETWIEAMKVCQRDSGYLAEIGSEKENSFIHGLITDNSDRWLGGTDLSAEGKWVWIRSGSNMTYSKWRPTEPNNTGNNENCLAMDVNGQWNDRTCHDTKKYICETAFAKQEIIG